MTALYLDFDDGCKAVEPMSEYILSRYYKIGQGITIGGIGYSVICSFVFSDTYHILLTRKLNGDMTARIMNGKVIS